MKGEDGVWSVSQLTALIKARLESDERLVNCWVVGEISNFKHHTSGHMYFTLKDDQARIRAVMFAGRNRNLTFRPEDGMRVICRGSVGVFERDGQYQLYVEEMQPDGIGALYVAFLQLRDRLAAEGLFDPARKRPLPRYPRRIGVVTSPTGAVIRDICATLQRRYPLASVVLAPALVQGPEAAASIEAALQRLAGLQGDERVDVIIVGRGGGSLEELWPFNEERVARAVAGCPVPVVSAVGHETDVTICDFAADKRAPTPTAAAEMVAPDQADLRVALLQMEARARQALRWKLDVAHERLQRAVGSPAWAQPKRWLDLRRQVVDHLEGQARRFGVRRVHIAREQVNRLQERLHRLDVRMPVRRASSILEQRHLRARTLMFQRLTQAKTQWERVAAALEALNPLAVLRRGYSVVYRADTDQVLTSVRQVQPGDPVRIQFADGSVLAKVAGGKEDGYDRTEQARLDL
ncbi:exodeoxyribonuclease 7 large subunit [Alicyclobacillus cellulosilyticus]|uniref:Exodeoxyribonuclease 7 large subunit n=1 Tax=Alicyclobacillus cellulosilyticus TaxID=1003997 RepID=A0A917K0L3_9BACL|nr:exodeoxyribonuclease VII large subunit [Alicyclobacillus cellulosilyticus]GGI95863.1 exodeoxyribonuclease 7 large subunit [Alicyclobacillus cellulosilyticus]